MGAADQGSAGFRKRSYVPYAVQILGQALYTRGLPCEQQAIVDEAQSKVTMDSTQTVNPVMAVSDIVKIVAVDPPIAKVTSLIPSFNRVMYCRRSKLDKLPVFVSRF